MDDLSLLRDYANTGSSRAFTLLVERHVDLVYSAALRRTHGDFHRAREVTQMVFIDLARKAAQLTRHPLLAGWLHQSTRWAASGVLRAERRRQAHEQAAGIALEIHASGELSSETADWEILRPLLDGALDELRESDREAVLLRFFSNLSFADIATRFDIGENAARMRVERALDKLHGVLRRHGVKSSAAALAVAMSQQAVAAAPVGMAATLVPTSLATAAASATGLTGFAALKLFMTKAQFGLAALVVAALAIGLSRELAARNTEQDALNQVRQEQEVRRAEIARLSTRAVTEQKTLEALPSIASVPPPDPIMVERKRLDLIVRKGELDGEYALLFQRLKLDRGTLDSLKTLIVERNQAIYDAYQVAKEEKVDILSGYELEELQREATRTVDQQIAALLGSEKFSRFDRYVSTTPIRNLVSSPWNPETILTEEREEVLIALFEKTAPDFFATIYGRQEPASIPEAFLKEAKPLLPASTYERLTMSDESTVAWNRMNEIARGAARQGKLKLSKGSAKIYGPPANDGKSTAPANPASPTSAP